jgi:hypothetical protein
MLLESAAAAAGVATIVYLRLLIVAWSRRKNSSIVGVVEHQQPPSVLRVAQPVVHQLEHIRLRVPPAAHLDLVGDFPEALLQSRRVADMRPEHPRVRRQLGSAVAVLDGQLRFSADVLGISTNPRVC